MGTGITYLQRGSYLKEPTVAKTRLGGRHVDEVRHAQTRRRAIALLPVSAGLSKHLGKALRLRVAEGQIKTVQKISQVAGHQFGRFRRLMLGNRLD
jgi:hypothetical protein